MTNKIMSLLGKLMFTMTRGIKFFIKKYQKSLFKSCGDQVFIANDCTFTPETITIGNDVTIGRNACFQSPHGEIIIGNHVMFGPRVHIHGGNHRFDVIGKYMKGLEKTKGIDGQVIIEDDVWIGANVTILKKVRVGRGSIVGAGSVVTKDIPPYSIYTGVPDVKVRERFTEEEILEHERIQCNRYANQ